jgi:membrane protease YdiL (CAAX protease family)
MTNAGAPIHEPRFDAANRSGTQPIDPAGIPPTSSGSSVAGTPAAPFDPAETRSLSTARWALALALFLVLSFGLAWLVAAPLWIDGGLTNPLAPQLAVAMMLTPTIAVAVVIATVDRGRRPLRRLGLWPLMPAPRFLGYCAIALFGTIALVFASLPVGALFGVYPADFVTFSGFRELIEQSIARAGLTGDAAALPAPIALLVAAQFLNVLIGALLNVLPALGEEIGWRGWLLPHLLRLGLVPALLLSGLIWGLWHAPLILLGYNYPGAPGWLALLLMVGVCTVTGAVFGWLRLRSESVWPAAIAHGAFNAAAGFSIVFVASGHEVDTVHAGILGWSGWLVPLVLVIVLAATGQFRPSAAWAERAGRSRMFVS